ncbi:MAG TPA: hypothetical protein VMK65_05155 [Longimicrobiales bacterium]|nr:hypothetical protein [Longimicrobiales bacterium]
MVKGRAAAALALLAAACGGDPAGPDASMERVQLTPAEGLEQIVTVAATEITRGDTLEVRSVVRALGSAGPLEARICGLDLRGLELDDPFGRCAGYSMRAELAPGDSLVQVDRAVVASGVGSYTLRVRHLVEPDTWVEVPLRVVGAR